MEGCFLGVAMTAPILLHVGVVCSPVSSRVSWGSDRPLLSSRPAPRPYISSTSFPSRSENVSAAGIIAVRAEAERLP